MHATVLYLCTCSVVSVNIFSVFCLSTCGGTKKTRTIVELVLCRFCSLGVTVVIGIVHNTKCEWRCEEFITLNPIVSVSPSPFSGWTWVSQCLLEQRMMEVVVTTGAISRAKLQSNHHHQQTNTWFFYRPDALPVAQSTVSRHWREYCVSLILDILNVERKCRVPNFDNPVQEKTDRVFFLQHLNIV